LPYYQVLFFSYFFYTLLICSIGALLISTDTVSVFPSSACQTQLWSLAAHPRPLTRCPVVQIHCVPLWIKLWKITIFHGKTHYKWWFSIAMLIYQRVISDIL
jgi:hypothetical protein